VTVSVVIPVKDDPRVFEAVASVRDHHGLTVPPELIVVDNGSSPEFVASLRGLGPGVRLLFEATPGPAAARNTGVRAATGDVILFTDADCRVEPGWAAAAVRGLEASSVSLLVGASRPTAGTRAERVMARHTHGGLRWRLASTRYIDTRNLAVRRDVFTKVRFDERLLRFEDHAFGFSVAAAGFGIGASPAMRVHHSTDGRFDRYLAKRLVGGWSRRAALPAGLRTGGAGVRAFPVAARQWYVRTGRRIPWLAPLGWRVALAGGRALQRSLPAIPEPAAAALLGALAWLALSTGVLLHARGLPQPSVAEALAGPAHWPPTRQATGAKGTIAGPPPNRPAM
jgi:GT2 family glycosyltransferase